MNAAGQTLESDGWVKQWKDVWWKKFESDRYSILFNIDSLKQWDGPGIHVSLTFHKDWTEIRLSGKSMNGQCKLETWEGTAESCDLNQLAKTLVNRWNQQ